MNLLMFPRILSYWSSNLGIFGSSKEKHQRQEIRRNSEMLHALEPALALTVANAAATNAKSGDPCLRARIPKDATVYVGFITMPTLQLQSKLRTGTAGRRKLMINVKVEEKLSASRRYFAVYGETPAHRP